MSTITTDAQRERLEHRFNYHKPKNEGQTKRYEQIRAACKGLALLIDELCPDSREKACAYTKAEEAMFWANAAIARNE